MKTLVIVALSVVLVSCSYDFSSPPFESAELTEITKSEFGKELLSHIENFPDIDQAGNPGDNLTEATRVYVVADDFLIQQNEKDEGPGWDLTIWTKNRHHILSCSLMQDETLPIANVDVQTKEDGTISLEGSTEQLTELAIQLSLTAPKLCVVIPYADASDVRDTTIKVQSLQEDVAALKEQVAQAQAVNKEIEENILEKEDLIKELQIVTEDRHRVDRLMTELDAAVKDKTEYVTKIEQLTTELEVAATTKAEYANRIETLTTELNVATNAVLGEQEKAQHLETLNQKLDEELSSFKTRSLLFLVIGGIAAAALILIVVRSRMKKADRQL